MPTPWSAHHPACAVELSELLACQASLYCIYVTRKQRLATYANALVCASLRLRC